MGDRKPGFLRKNFVRISRFPKKPGYEGGVRKS